MNAVSTGTSHNTAETQLLYAATGGTDFLIQAWLLARRRRRFAAVRA